MGILLSANRQSQRSVIVPMEDSDEIKVLLLGPGESGKSTILKQMRILQLSGFTDAMLTAHRVAIQLDVIESIQQLITGVQALQLGFSSNDVLEKAESVGKICLSEIQKTEFVPSPTDIWQAIQSLWEHDTIQECYRRRYEITLMDAAKYYLDNLERIRDPSYTPTEQDVLYQRTPTIGIVEMTFTMDNLKFRIVDVGGQKSQRRKWLHQFDCVNMVIFLVAISDYDKTMEEDNSTNRMVDSIRLFSETINCHWFTMIDIILFLNKIDLFKERLPKVPITSAFPEYNGPQVYDLCVKHIKRQFLSKNNYEGRTISAHETCATDKTQMQKIMKDVIRTIINTSLGIRGLLS